MAKQKKSKKEKIENKEKIDKKDKKKEKTDKKEQKEKKTSSPRKTEILKFLKSKKLGFILAALQFFASAVLLIILMYLNMLPAKYFAPVIVLLLVLVAYSVLTQFSKKFRTFGKIFSLILSIIFIVASVMLNRANRVIDSISGAEHKTDIVSVFVMANDEANAINDILTDKFGIVSTLDREKTDKTIEEIQTKHNTTITIEEFTDTQTLVEALYAGTVRAIIINEAFIATIEDIQYGDNYPYKFFTTDTKKLTSNTIVTEIERVPIDADVTKDVFMMYLSGIDVTGSISTTSRSDVNIIAVVNPVTYQVLLLSTPRDYYIKTTVSGEAKDKLTHAGLYGVDCSMGTLDMLYNIDIDYYFRVNFTGFVEVIDALGGITVHSDYSFYTTHGGYYIAKGENTLNGAQALGFARERYAFPDGDRQRGRNHMEVITAVIEKMASPALLNNYTSLMAGLEGSFETSLTSDDISKLVKLQLDKMPAWNIVTYSVSGPGDHLPTYSAPNFNAWVMLPDTTYVENAKTLINQVINGQTIDLNVLQPTANY